MKIHKYFCDNCKREVENVECSDIQLRFKLIEMMDDGEEFDFCGVECLKEFVNKRKFEMRFYKYPELKKEAGK